MNNKAKSQLFERKYIESPAWCLTQKELLVVVESSRHFVLIYLSILTSLLEYNCFTMVCYFLLYNKVNQLYIYIYPHISSLLSLSSHPPYPIPLGGHKAPN